ncbi:hypothetical protein SELMODRAFT_409155 [Selaginella moellendorffii]|uniref:Uncharacterized protein n=1 Tax=Selaginella moellendorffii TaxID=88036 RepID=D8RAJ3_SELML|nr:hypothetical protein SELMODRAFT_409155 [Selaginella moellendorffii]
MACDSHVSLFEFEFLNCGANYCEANIESYRSAADSMKTCFISYDTAAETNVLYAAQVKRKLNDLLTLYYCTRDFTKRRTHAHVDRVYHVSQSKESANTQRHDVWEMRKLGRYDILWIPLYEPGAKQANRSWLLTEQVFKADGTPDVLLLTRMSDEMFTERFISRQQSTVVDMPVQSNIRTVLIHCERSRKRQLERVERLESKPEANLLDSDGEKRELRNFELTGSTKHYFFTGEGLF